MSQDGHADVFTRSSDGSCGWVMLVSGETSAIPPTRRFLVWRLRQEITRRRRHETAGAVRGRSKVGLSLVPMIL
jgi:hypothetical protein